MVLGAACASGDGRPMPPRLRTMPRRPSSLLASARLLMQPVARLRPWGGRRLQAPILTAPGITSRDGSLAVLKRHVGRPEFLPF